MKTSDIKVGSDYAYLSHKWSTARRVTVLATGQPLTAGWGYSRKTVKNGVKVKWVTGPQAGTESVVPSREIDRTWEAQEAANAAAKEAREMREDAHRNTATRRANLARRIEDRLEAHGVELTTYPARVYDKTQRAALLAVGFEEVESPYAHGDKGFATRFTNLDDFMRSGDVAEKVVTVLLADSEVSA